MPRPTNVATTPAQDNYDPAKLEEAGQAAQQLQQLRAGYDQGRDLVNQMLGQAQALHAASDLLRTGAVSKHAQIKENKLYQQLAGVKTPHGAVLKGTWEEYCNILGRSVDMVDRDIANLQAFGEEALEAMSRAGIGYRELRQFRKLPTDQRTALIEAAKEGDKDSLLELAEDLIAKHTKEKEVLTKERDEHKGNYEALDKLNAKNMQELKDLKQKLIKDNLAPTSWDERFSVYIAQVEEADRAIHKQFSTLEDVRKAAMVPLAEDEDNPDLTYAAQVLASKLVQIHNSCANSLRELGRIFDLTLGNFTEERIDLYALPKAYDPESHDE